MEIETLLAESKARFNHNAGKHYLREKYNSKLILADQGGLWKATPEVLTFLYNTHLVQTEVILMDTFNNPVKVNALELYKKLMAIYNTVMEEWYNELKELEGKR